MVASGSILIVVVIALAVGFARNSKDVLVNLFVLAVVIGLLVARGNFLVIGEHETPYKQICEYALIIYAIYYACSASVRMRRTALVRFLVFAFLLTMSLALLAFFPTGAVGATGAVKSVTWDTIFLQGAQRQPVVFELTYLTGLVKFFLTLFVILIIVSSLNRSDWERVLSKTLVWSEIIVIVCLIEVIAKYGFRSNLFHEVSDAVLGVSTSTYVDLVVRGDGILLCGFTKEASHYSFALSVLFIIIICWLSCKRRLLTRAQKNLSYAAIVAIAVEQAFAMSFSMFYFAACSILVVLVVLMRGKPLIQGSIVVTSVLMTLVLVFIGLPVLASVLDGSTYFGNRIKVLQSNLLACMDGSWIKYPNSGDNSTTVRLGSMFETLRLLGNRPLLGLGFGSLTAHSSFAMMIGDWGLLGFGFYCCAIYGGMAPARNRVMYGCLVVSYLLMTLLASIGVRPFTDYWVLVLLYSFSRASEASVPAGAAVKGVSPSVRTAAFKARMRRFRPIWPGSGRTAVPALAYGTGNRNGVPSEHALGRGCCGGGKRPILVLLDLRSEWAGARSCEGKAPLS